MTLTLVKKNSPIETKAGDWLEFVCTFGVEMATKLKSYLDDRTKALNMKCETAGRLSENPFLFR